MRPASLISKASALLRLKVNAEFMCAMLLVPLSLFFRNSPNNWEVLNGNGNMAKYKMALNYKSKILASAKV